MAKRPVWGPIWAKMVLILAKKDFFHHLNYQYLLYIIFTNKYMHNQKNLMVQTLKNGQKTRLGPNLTKNPILGQFLGLDGQTLGKSGAKMEDENKQTVNMNFFTRLYVIACFPSNPGRVNEFSQSYQPDWTKIYHKIRHLTFG